MEVAWVSHFTGRRVIVSVEQVPEVGGVGYQAEGLTIVIICMYMQVSLGSSVLVRRKPYISLNDAVRNCPLYAVLSFFIHRHAY